MIDQDTRRRPDFKPGVSVRLADGQFWILPVPARCAAADPSIDATPEISSYRTYELLLEAITEAVDDSDQFLAELALAIELLGTNYALGHEDYRSLLTFDPLDPARSSLRTDLHSVAIMHLRLGFGRAQTGSMMLRWHWKVPRFRSRRNRSQMSSPAA